MDFFTRALHAGAGYQTIVGSLTEAIMEGQLKPGDQLPTQRELAQQLGVAVATVTHAYSEAQRRGLIVAKAGRGTYVSAIASRPTELVSEDTGPDIIDLSISRPPTGGAAPFLSRALQTLSAWPRLDELLGTESANGAWHHRVAIAQWISGRGHDVPPNQIIACSGVQHALSVILGALARPGDIVATEALNFPGIKLLADIHRIPLLGVPIDEHGMQVDELQRMCSNNNVRFVLCSPTAHNPTTVTLSEERRYRLAQLAKAHDFLVIENDILGLLPEHKLPSVFSLQPRRTIYVTGTSKVLATGLRLGFIAAATSLLHPLMGGVRTTIWMPPPLMLGLFEEWVRQGEAELILDWHRKEIAARLEVVDEVLGLGNLSCDASSYHVWMPLPSHCDSSEFTDRAYEQGVALSPSDTFTLTPSQEAPHAVRISLGFPNDRSTLRKGLERLEGLLKDGPHANASKGGRVNASG